MKKNNQVKESWINSPWPVGLGTGIFSLLLTIGYDYFKEIPILTTIGTILKWLGSISWSILNFDLKVWWVLTGIATLILLVFVISALQKKETTSSLPFFYNYREERFKKWKWSWEWKWYDSRDTWVVYNMQAHCPKCDTVMIDGSNRQVLVFDCPRCDFRAVDRECDQPNKIESLILDNVARKRKENQS